MRLEPGPNERCCRPAAGFLDCPQAGLDCDRGWPRCCQGDKERRGGRFRPLGPFQPLTRASSPAGSLQHAEPRQAVSADEVLLRSCSFLKEKLVPADPLKRSITNAMCG
jgi:hypothetical protein